jgi:hypothetical protein
MGELKTGDLCSRLWTCFRSVKEMEKEARNQKSRWGFELPLIRLSRHRGRVTIESASAALIRETRSVTQPQQSCQ